jgi:hypothetical protein
MTQLSLFDPDGAGPDPKPTSDDVVRLRLLITVKAAPNPSEKYGETVCITGRSVDLSRRRWIRLYPINFRELGNSDRFRKYDIISIDARPARSDQRNESWKPYPHTLANEGHLEAWKPRRPWLDPLIERSMCQLNHNARDNPNAQSLALVRPTDVSQLKLHPHPGWTPAEQHKIDKYVEQLDLLDSRDRWSRHVSRARTATDATTLAAAGISRACSTGSSWRFNVASVTCRTRRRAARSRISFLDDCAEPTGRWRSTSATRPSGPTCSACLACITRSGREQPAHFLHDDVTVAPVLIGLEAQHRHPLPAARLGERVKRGGGLRPLQEIGKDRVGVRKLLRRTAKSGPVRLRVTQLSTMLVLNPSPGQRRPKCRLTEPSLTGDWGEPNVNEPGDPRGDEILDQFLDRASLVAHTEQAGLACGQVRHDSTLGLLAYLRNTSPERC